MPGSYTFILISWLAVGSFGTVFDIYTTERNEIKTTKNTKMQTTTITVYIKQQCTFICDCISFAGNQAVLTLDNNRGIKLWPVSDILLIEPTKLP